MPRLISTRKEKWVKLFKPKQIKGLPLNLSAAIEARYNSKMRALIERMTADTNRELVAYFKTPKAKEYFTEDAPLSSQVRALLNSLLSRFEQIFTLAAPRLAGGMVGETDANASRALKASLKQLSGGLSIKTDFITGDLKEIISASIAENVGLIKSIPRQYFTQIEGAVMRSITTGNGLQDLEPFLAKQKGVTQRRARIIARDQTSKVFSNINFSRMERAGVEEYEWLHSAGGQEPRPLHIRAFSSGGLNGGIFRIDSPPVIDAKTGQRGKPGDLINCHCRAIPVVRFKES